MKKILIAFLLATPLFSMQQEKPCGWAQDASLRGHDQQPAVFEKNASSSPSSKESIHPWQSPHGEKIEPKTPHFSGRTNARKRDFLPPLVTPEQERTKERFNYKHSRIISPVKTSFPDSAPFFAAVERGDALFVHNAAQNKSFITSRNIAGETPLHVAVRNCHEKIVKLLLALDADPCEPNSAGITPLQLAEQKVAQIQAEIDAHEDYDLGYSINCPAILRLLKEHSCCQPQRQIQPPSYRVPAAQDPDSSADSIYKYLSDWSQIQKYSPFKK